MGTVVLDDALKARLNGLNQHLEVRDADGRLVGHFLPDGDYMRLLYDSAKAEFARQETEEASGSVRRWDGSGGKSTAEVVASLRKLEAQLRQNEQGAGS